MKRAWAQWLCLGIIAAIVGFALQSRNAPDRIESPVTSAPNRALGVRIEPAEFVFAEPVLEHATAHANFVMKNDATRPITVVSGWGDCKCIELLNASHERFEYPIELQPGEELPVVAEIDTAGLERVRKFIVQLDIHSSEKHGSLLSKIGMVVRGAGRAAPNPVTFYDIPAGSTAECTVGLYDAFSGEGLEFAEVSSSTDRLRGTLVEVAKSGSAGSPGANERQPDGQSMSSRPVQPSDYHHRADLRIRFVAPATANAWFRETLSVGVTSPEIPPLLIDVVGRTARNMYEAIPAGLSFVARDGAFRAERRILCRVPSDVGEDFGLLSKPDFVEAELSRRSGSAFHLTVVCDHASFDGRPLFNGEIVLGHLSSQTPRLHVGVRLLRL